MSWIGETAATFLSRKSMFVKVVITIGIALEARGTARRRYLRRVDRWRLLRTHGDRPDLQENSSYGFKWIPKWSLEYANIP